MSSAQNGTALVLAAHGSNTDTAVHELVNGYVDRVAHLLPEIGEVAAAFHLGEPSFSTVLDQLRAQHVTVVPLMTSCGYFCETVLPKALARNRRYPDVHLEITDPVGTHIRMADLASQRVADRIVEQKFDPAKTAVIIVGHGTPRSSRSRLSTKQLADILRTLHPSCEVSHAFLDCEPLIEDVFAATKQPCVVIEPFLIADGPHASQDIPRRLGMVALDAPSLPMTQRVGNHTVVCDSAMGTDPGMLDLIADLALRSLSRSHERADSSASGGRVETTKA